MRRAMLGFVALLMMLPATTQAREIDVRDHGARGGSAQVQTRSIQQAIDACAAGGGGIVRIPAGTFTTGAIRLRSHVTLSLDEGAVLKGSEQLDDYRIDGHLVGLISAIDADDVGICGRGVIDGNGMAFMDASKPNFGEDYDRQFIRQRDQYLRLPDAGADGPLMPKARPGNMVVFANCTTVRISEVTLREPPYWTLHINGSSDVEIRGVTINNRQDVPNNDGIHVTTSRDVRISGCDITAGDDAIAISGVNDHAPSVPGFIGYDKPCQTVTINDCTLRSRSCGMRVGYGHNDVRNIVARNLTIDANRGIGIFTRNPGRVSDVVFDDVRIRTHLYRGHWWGKAEPIHISALPMSKSEPAGAISHVRFDHVTAEAEAGIIIYATDAGLIRNVVFNDLKLAMRGSPLQANYGGNIDLRPALDPALRIFRHDIPPLLARGVTDLRLNAIDVHWAGDVPEFFSRRIDCQGCEDVRQGDVNLKEGL